MLAKQLNFTLFLALRCVVNLASNLLITHQTSYNKSKHQLLCLLIIKEFILIFTNKIWMEVFQLIIKLPLLLTSSAINQVLLNSGRTNRFNCFLFWTYIAISVSTTIEFYAYCLHSTFDTFLTSSRNFKLRWCRLELYTFTFDYTLEERKSWINDFDIVLLLLI